MRVQGAEHDGRYPDQLPNIAGIQRFQYATDTYQLPSYSRHHGDIKEQQGMHFEDDSVSHHVQQTDLINSYAKPFHHNTKDHKVIYFQSSPFIVPNINSRQPINFVGRRLTSRGGCR